MKIYKFPAKLLLFGEYGVIKNSYGLTIPYNNYFGYLRVNSLLLSKDIINKLNFKLRNYYMFLHSHFSKYKLKHVLYFNVLFHDIYNHKLYFHSNIPEKSGLGSSGSLIASLYDKYSVNKNIKSMILLKKIFAVMESYYHGNSSGIDPLTSYFKKPLFIQPHNLITPVKIPNYSYDKLTIFILYSGVLCETSIMMHIFLKKYNNYKFKQLFNNEYLNYNKISINYFLRGNTKLLFNNIKHISIWQYLNLSEMIPKNIVNVWREGLSSNMYYLKLCGSGGGGYFLGFTYNYNYIKNYLYNFFPKKLIFI